MRIVSLIDNNRLTGRKDLRTEPGLSMCIFTDKGQILFDSGVSDGFRLNAQQLNVDLAQVTHAVLSHHHFDHGGGLGTFLEANSQAKIYLRSRSSTEQLYAHYFGLFKRRVGLDETLFQRYPHRFAFINQFTEIASDVFILTRIEKRHPAPKGNRHLFIHTQGSSRPDDFEHELILVVRESAGLVVFTGCSHHGLLNMLDAVQEHFSGQSIKAIFGGFHLISMPLMDSAADSKADAEVLGRAIQKFPLEKVYTGHCTGEKAYRILKEIVGAKLDYFATGCEVEI